MAGENGAATVANVEAQAADEGRKRERSSIGFPYMHLDDGLAAARAIHDNVATGTCSADQLAAWLNQSPSSSAFRVRLSASRVFGLIDSERSDAIKLTELGRKAVDPKREREARVDAFLAVPLYRALFEKFKGNVLPPATALEREIVSLGVAAKQKERARQVFERSAEQAGFFEQGRGRLVRPGVPVHDEDKRTKEKKRDGSGDDGGSLDPLMEALIQKLPGSGSPWPSDDRVIWLQMFVMASQIAYGQVEAIEIKKAGG